MGGPRWTRVPKIARRAGIVHSAMSEFALSGGESRAGIGVGPLTQPLCDPGRKSGSLLRRGTLWPAGAHAVATWSSPAGPTRLFRGVSGAEISPRAVQAPEESTPTRSVRARRRVSACPLPLAPMSWTDAKHPRTGWPPLHRWQHETRRQPAASFHVNQPSHWLRAAPTDVVNPWGFSRTGTTEAKGLRPEVTVRISGRASARLLDPPGDRGLSGHMSAMARRTVRDSWRGLRRKARSRSASAPRSPGARALAQPCDVPIDPTAVVSPAARGCWADRQAQPSDARRDARATEFGRVR
jgi:hypothetical protein